MRQKGECSGIHVSDLSNSHLALNNLSVALLRHRSAGRRYSKATCGDLCRVCRMTSDSSTPASPAPVARPTRSEWPAKRAGRTFNAMPSIGRVRAQTAVFSANDLAPVVDGAMGHDHTLPLVKAGRRESHQEHWAIRPHSSNSARARVPACRQPGCKSPDWSHH
jgi:hypothetical protein